jgi:cellulose synthase operon protein C
MSRSFHQRIGRLSTLAGATILFVAPAISQQIPKTKTAQEWVTTAASCADSLCRFSSLQQALRVEPENRAALLALADYYRGREQREKARDILRKIVSRDSGDFEARKNMADLLIEVGDRERGLEAYAALETKFAGVHWLTTELATAYERAGLLQRAVKLAKRAHEENPAGSREQEQLLRLYERTRDGAGMLALLREMVASAPGEVDNVARLARAMAAQGDAEGAKTLLRKALDSNGHDAGLRLELAEIIDESGRTEEATLERSRTVTDNRNFEDVRRRLQWAGADTLADPDAEFLANVDLRQRPDANGQKAVALADVRIDRVQPNGLASTRVQQYFLIGDAVGAREFGTRAVQFAPASESLRILHARLHKRDGRVVEAEEGAESSVADLKTAMYYDVRSRVVRYPGAEAGDVVELDYRVTPEASENPYGNYFGSLVLLQNTIPAKLKRYVLVTPAEREFYITERRVPEPAETTIADGKRTQRWEMHDAPALPNEPRGPSATEVGSYVNVSTFATWNDLGQWYAELLKPQLALDSSLQEVAARMLAEHPDEQDRIRAIHRFVLRNTHYVALEFGIYSYKPYPVSQVYARRFGDCKDKASLMIALLRATGIETQLALVRTRRLGAVADNAASIVPFNHAIAYIPRYDMYLDGTAEYANARELPLDDQGAMALTVGVDGNNQMRRIPVTQATENYTRRVVRAEVRRDGNIEFIGSAETRGEDAPGLRREYEVAERQRESFRQTLAEVFPSVRLDNVQVDGAHDLEKNVTVNFRGVIDTFAGRPTLSLSSSWIPRHYVQTLAPLASRAQTLMLPAGWTTEEELNLAFPANAKVELPKAQRLETPFGNAEFAYERSGSNVAIRTKVEFTRTQIAVDEYPAFREFCRALESAFRQEAKVTLQ